MNRFNPLYLVFLLIALLLFLTYQLSNVKTDLTQGKEAYIDCVKLSTELSGLKNAYSIKLNLSSIKSASLIQKIDEYGMTISSNSMDVKDLNCLMRKLLNGAYNISTLNIKRISDTKVTLYLEIKW